MLDILKRISIASERNSIDVAKDYVRLELDNLKGITEHRCQNTKYYFGSYCKYCENYNCSANKRMI